MVALILVINLKIILLDWSTFLADMNASAKTEQTEKHTHTKKSIVERKKRDELREIIRQCEKDKRRAGRE